MNRIEKCVELFLARNYSFNRPLLLALSGGVDSSVLASILLHVKSKRKLDLHIVHIDHSWRTDSGEQALLLQDRFEALQIPFYLFTLDPPHAKNNLEEKARESRLEIFKELQTRLGAEALLLGHHEDDLSETMLKRIFEQAPFPFWAAMEEISFHGDLVLWRPLLKVQKKEIITYAKEKKIRYLHDSTEEDERFLRNRMRKKLIPELEQSFGKSISSSLSHLREQSKKLKSYMTVRTEALRNSLQENENGFCLDLKDAPFPVHEYEIEFFLTDFCRRAKSNLSAPQKERIAKLLAEGDQEGTFTTEGVTVRVRGKRAHFEMTHLAKRPKSEENSGKCVHNLPKINNYR